jgi:hypothetical protein
MTTQGKAFWFTLLQDRLTKIARDLMSDYRRGRGAP